MYIGLETDYMPLHHTDRFKLEFALVDTCNMRIDTEHHILDEAVPVRWAIESAGGIVMLTASFTSECYEPSTGSLFGPDLDLSQLLTER